MKLPSTGREYYALEITTSPAVAAWEASFDGGATWVAGALDLVGNLWRWLVAGPDFDPSEPGVVEADYTIVTAETSTCCQATCSERTPHRHPFVRAIDTPEVIVRSAPKILLTSGKAGA